LCLFYYGDNEALRIYHQSEISEDLIGTPLYQQAFRWFREKGIVNSIRSHNDKCHEYYLIHNGKAFQSYHSSTYEQAELECLNHLIRLFNQNK